jgi:hypothetical protein
LIRPANCRPSSRRQGYNVAILREEDDYLVRARGLIEAAIRRRWSEGLITRDADGVFTAYLGANEVERLMKGPERQESAVPEARWDPDRPLSVLARQLSLGETELDVLAVLLACESDPRAARLATYLGGNQTPNSLTLELLLEIVYRARYPRQSDAAAAAFRDLAPSRTIRRLRYVTFDGADKRVALAQGVRLEGRTAAWLLGNRELDAELASFSRIHEPGERGPADVDPGVVTAVRAAFRAGGRIIDIKGPRQSGRELVLRQAAAELGRPLLVVTGRGLGADRLALAFREASLFGALLAFTDGDDVLTGEGILTFRNCLPVFHDSIALLGCRDAVPLLGSLRPTTTVELRVPPIQDRLGLWTRHLGEASRLSEVDLKYVAATYNLGVSGIVNASAAARETASFTGEPLGKAHIHDAIRQLFDSDLSTIARRMDVKQSWADLVLPDDLERSVRSIVDRVHHRAQVLGDWGFARKIGKGLGLTVLFSGEPGTGKSMVAGLLAAELGLDLYVVDLSQVSSKWLGETEKNIGRTFDAAEAGHVLLLFDEADALLTKRTSDVKSSNDRYANQETNYILARLEQFEGIAFFTTNLASAIDPAIARRMSINIQFPFPDVDMRELLWRRMMPKEAPVSAGINFEALASRYDVSGGIIRNMVLRAAYLAARDKRPIEMGHLQEAAEMEYRDRGALGSGGRLV